MRITVEGWALTDPRRGMLGDELAITRRQALGLLVDVWHGTQEAGLVDVPLKMLRAIVAPEPGDKWTREQAIAALVEAGYVDDLGDGTFRIHGNQAHVEGITKSKERRAKRSEANRENVRKRWERERARRAAEAEEERQAGLEGAGAVAGGELPAAADDVEPPPATTTQPDLKLVPRAAEEPAAPAKPKKARKVKPPVPADPQNLAIAADWLAHARDTMPWIDAPSWTVEGFAEEVAKVRRRVTGLEDAQQVRAMLEWAKRDEFWNDKISSPGALLEKSKNGLRKVDNLLTQMRGSQKTGSAAALAAGAEWAAAADAAEARGETVNVF